MSPPLTFMRVTIWLTDHQLCGGSFHLQREHPLVSCRWWARFPHLWACSPTYEERASEWWTLLGRKEGLSVQWASTRCLFEVRCRHPPWSHSSLLTLCSLPVIRWKQDWGLLNREALRSILGLWGAGDRNGASAQNQCSEAVTCGPSASCVGTTNKSVSLQVLKPFTRFTEPHIDSWTQEAESSSLFSSSCLSQLESWLLLQGTCVSGRHPCLRRITWDPGRHLEPWKAPGTVKVLAHSRRCIPAHMM